MPWGQSSEIPNYILICHIGSKQSRSNQHVTSCSRLQQREMGEDPNAILRRAAMLNGQDVNKARNSARFVRHVSGRPGFKLESALKTPCPLIHCFKAAASQQIFPTLPRESSNHRSHVYAVSRWSAPTVAQGGPDKAFKIGVLQAMRLVRDCIMRLFRHVLGLGPVLLPTPALRQPFNQQVVVRQQSSTSELSELRTLVQLVH